jgi:predicted TIM-barrel fold metal-dependent hydrolase
MIQGMSQVPERVLAARGSPYIVVSTDSHSGPSLERSLRQYCPPRHLEAFDDFCARRQHRVISLTNDSEFSSLVHDRVKECPGHDDPDARLRDMDDQGIAAEVIFAGGQNDEALPWLGDEFGAGSAEYPLELRAEGARIWNRWLADFCRVAPERLIGAVQIPIWDVEASVREIEWARNAGLTAINFPAPRRDFAPYIDPVYEPFWQAVEALDMPLLTHAGGGEVPLGFTRPGTELMLYSEVHFFSRRSLWELIFGLVFEDHPKLRLVFTETRVTWAPSWLAELDSIYELQDQFGGRRIPKYPSEYFASNCFIAGSFMAPFEAAARHEVGIANLMWGSDYPHIESTWPFTRLCLRNTFAGVPEDEARSILGENAIGVYGCDRDALREIADRIGPTPDELSVPLAADEFPDRAECATFAFRTRGNYS